MFYVNILRKNVMINSVFYAIIPLRVHLNNLLSIKHSFYFVYRVIY